MADSETIDTQIFTRGAGGGGGAELLNVQHRVSNEKQSNTHRKKKVTEACYRISPQPYIPVRIGIGVERGRVRQYTDVPTNGKTVCSNG